MKKQIVTNLKDLQIPCIPVCDGEDISSICQDLKDSLDPSKGYALAANQIGYNKRIIYINIKELDLDGFLINPTITMKVGKIQFNEGCLSFPGIHVKTDRAKAISVTCSTDNKLFPVNVIFADLESIIVQHEIDHLDGKTMFDRKHRSK